MVKLEACPYVHTVRRQGCSVVNLEGCPSVGGGSGEENLGGCAASDAEHGAAQPPRFISLTL